MRVPNGESTKPAKCSFPGSDCPNDAMTGSPFCQMHIAADPAKVQEERREVQRVRRQSSPPQQEQDFDFAVAGAKMAQRLVVEESKARLEFFRKQAEHPGRPIKQMPFRAFTRPVRKDRTAMTHPQTGESLVKPGWACRWVRKTDSQGRPSDERLEEFKAWGYEPVTYRDGDGQEKPLEGLFGVAMQCPLEHYAARQAEYTPVGAYNRYDLLEDAEAAVQELNRKAGTRAVALTAEEEHRSQRVEISPGQKIVEEY